MSNKSSKGSKKKRGPNVIEICTNFAKPIADELGLVIWDVQYTKEGATWYLRVFADKQDEPVSIDDCVSLSRQLEKKLDEEDPIPQTYCLEVSSPGIERRLRTDEHFKLSVGLDVLVRLYKPLEDGGREIKGNLEIFENDILVINDNRQIYNINKKDAALVRLLAEWDDYYSQD